MYQVAVQRNFIAQHFLIGGDWGAENHPHSHHFRLEVKLAGPQLDKHGYLFDISLLNKVLEQVIGLYRDKLLNDLPDFAGKNPSVENFAFNIFTGINVDFHPPGVEHMCITLWEDQDAWASYEGRLSHR